MSRLRDQTPEEARREAEMMYEERCEADRIAAPYLLRQWQDMLHEEQEIIERRGAQFVLLEDAQIRNLKKKESRVAYTEEKSQWVYRADTSERRSVTLCLEANNGELIATFIGVDIGAISTALAYQRNSGEPAFEIAYWHDNGETVSIGDSGLYLNTNEDGEIGIEGVFYLLEERWRQTLGDGTIIFLSPELEGYDLWGFTFPLQAGLKRLAASSQFEVEAKLEHEEGNISIHIKWSKKHMAITWDAERVTLPGEFCIEFVAKETEEILGMAVLGVARDGSRHFRNEKELDFNPCEIPWGFRVFMRPLPGDEE